MSDPLTIFRRFRRETADDVSAALLTLAAMLDSDQQAPLTVKQAAERRGVSKDVIYDFVREGKLRAERTGRTLRIRAADLDAM